LTAIGDDFHCCVAIAVGDQGRGELRRPRTTMRVELEEEEGIPPLVVRW
jgi:hypothetical protein